MRKKQSSNHAKIFDGLPKPVISHGKQMYEVDAGKCGGKRVRRRFHTAGEAREFQTLAKVQLRQLGDAFDILPAPKRAEILSTIMEMEHHKTSLDEVWKYWLKRHSGSGSTLKQVCTKYINELEAKGRRKIYLDTHGVFLKRLQRFFGEETPISNLSEHDLEAFMKSYPPRSQPDTHRRVKGLWSWAISRKMATDNPMDVVIKPSMDELDTAILPNDEVKQLLSLSFGTYPKTAPYLILALFGGIRRYEASRLEWGMVDIDRCQVTVGAGVAKTRSRRVVHLLGNSTNILRHFKDLGSPVYPGDNPVKTILGKMNSDNNRNILRHTAATHMVNHHESFEKAAIELGNSPDILRKHYYGLATPEQTQEFIQII